MKMLQDYELFMQLCEKRGISTPPEVLEAIKVGSSNGVLRLSCTSIIVPICEIIAQMLASSPTIRIVDLSDCMLLSKGLSYILSALCDGTNITSLNLKGNNINGPIVAQLGQVFIHNNTLRRLHVEWNSLGAHVDSFTKFCEGLTKNHNIEELDLRYNQISPYCAEALSKVLKWNKSLRTLDLAWNTIGLQGGQLLLAGMRENRFIARLNLRGNCIPNDIVQEIEECAYNNQCRKAISESDIPKNIEIAKSVMIKDKVQVLSCTDSDSTVSTRSECGKKKKVRPNKDHESVKSPIDNSQNTKTDSNESLLKLKIIDDHPRDIGAQKGDVLTENLSNDQNMKMAEVHSKMKELNQILQDRTAAINLLTNEITVKVAEIDALRLQVNQLQTEISQLREERGKFAEEKSKEITELKRYQSELEHNWQTAYKVLEESYNKSLLNKKESDLKIRRYERDIHKSSLEMTVLKEKLVSVTQTYEDLISKDKTEIHRLRRELKERENRHKIELNIVKNTLKETTQALEECQNQLQKSRGELRQVTENQLMLKARVNEMEHLDVRCKRSEETLLKVKEEKEYFEEKLTDAQRSIGTLQRQVASLQGELIEPQRRYELINVELDQEKQKTARLGQELNEERCRIREQNIQMQKMALQVTALNTQINEIQNNHAEALRERDKERRQLKEIIAHRERDLNELRADQVQRAGQLYAAFSKYLGSIGPNSAS